MVKHSSDNLRVKRRYLVWRKDSKGLSDASVDKSAAAVSVYETFLKGKDFRSFHSERARSFKRHLSSQQNQRTGSRLSDASINGTLREVSAFLNWLVDQPGYKSKITRSDIAYLSPDRKSDNARRATCWKPHPSPAQVSKLLEGMPSGNVLQRRDRSFIAFLFLTGSREGAAISIRLGHLDLKHACVHFDGRTVNTKFGKTFTTAFFPMPEPCEQILHGWIEELRQDHKFSTSDPLFPKTRVGVNPERRYAALGIDRSPWSNPSSGAKIFKKAFSDAGLPPFSPHRVRDTLAELAKDHCRTPEDYKAWSQNMGHDDVLTTFRSYGSVATGRQVDLMARFRKRGPLNDSSDDDFDIFE